MYAAVGEVVEHVHRPAIGADRARSFGRALEGLVDVIEGCGEGQVVSRVEE